MEFGVSGGDGVFQHALDGGGEPLAGTGDGAAVLDHGLARHLGGDAEVVHDGGEPGEGTVALVEFPEFEQVAQDGLLGGDGEVAVLAVALAGGGAIGAGDGLPAVGSGGGNGGYPVRHPRGRSGCRIPFGRARPGSG